MQMTNDLQNLLDELERVANPDVVLGENLQEIRWVLKDYCGTDL
jgi:hypothetical protein